MMSPEEKRAYARGYYASRMGRWPEHQPPFPPEEVIANLMIALRNLRDVADGICSTIDKDDEFAVCLGPAIDKADEAMIAVSEWLRKEGLFA